MTYVSKTNKFFKETVYDNLVELALLPYKYPKSRGSSYPIPDLGPALFHLAFWPFTIPAFIVTSSLALALAGLTAIIHGLTLLGAASADALCANKPVVV